MTTRQPTDLAPNAGRFSGFADLYDGVRPRPPDDLAAILVSYCGRSDPDVVDIGSGTGLSTRWAATWARSVIGVEPSSDMRSTADERSLPNVTYVRGYGHETNLKSQCADVVMAVQALHWMEPKETLAEVARVLRPGGVFSAIDCDWPPTVGSADLERAWADCRKTVRVYETRLAQGLSGRSLRAPLGESDHSTARGYSGRDAHGNRTLAEGVKSWSKDAHLERMIASGKFAWCHELALHREESGDAERFVSLMKSQGDYQTLVRAGLDDETLGVTTLEQTAERVLGRRARSWWFTYRVRIGVLPVDGEA